MDFLPEAFSALTEFKQFIIYKIVSSKKRVGKTDKFPIDYRTQVIANAHNPEIWLEGKNAVEIAKYFGSDYGVGFVFTENDPFWFLDIDECLSESKTEWSALALSLINAFPGALIEVSNSKRGLHIIGSGKAPEHHCKNISLNLEFYTAGRFVALTGINASGSAAGDYSIVLDWLVTNYFSSKISTVISNEWNINPCDQWNGPEEDTVLINRALQSQSSKNIFGNKASFKDLWEANASVLALTYPDPTRDLRYDESSADAALAQHLCFWTGNNHDRIRRLMLQSALNREKWNREDYLPRTIRSACGRQKEWLCDKLPQSIVTSIESQAFSINENPVPILVNGTTFLTINQQIDIFKGCVYVCDEHKILIPGGYLLNNERFRVMFGGYSMPIDGANGKMARSAWEAFTESRAFRSPRADTACFRPDLTPGAIITKDGQTLANIYWPVSTPRKTGDVSRFLWHLDKTHPDPRDRAIFLAYLAALVQYRGIKFQWAPLLQGVEGNGKTLYTRCIAFAIGDRYSHFPKSAEISGKFNDWLHCKIFIGVEDIYLHDSKFEVIETLKPMITSERQEIEPKGGAKITRDICANFLINTNHKDGLRKTRNDRRFAPFYTPQQSIEDLKKWGMLGDYFSDLYEWLKFHEGYAIISEYLHTYDIPDEFNPATHCKRAPHTTSTEAAIEQGQDNVEQEVLEAIAQGTLGFKGGWVSSIMLDRLLKDLNANRRIPLNKRRELMQSLGYDWHPGLADGRLTTIVFPDNGKPRLYVVHGHKDSGLLGGSGIAKAYSEAQKIVDSL